MRFTMAQPEVSCHPERFCRTRAPSSRRRSATACRSRRPGPGAGSLPRYTWYDAYAELREKLDALGRASRWRLPRSRRREPPRRPRGRGALRRRLLRQEHDADHAPASAPSSSLGTLVTDARDRGQPPLEPTAARARSASTPARRARSTSRASSTDALPLLLDAGAGSRSRGRAGTRWRTRSTAATSARTSARRTPARAGRAGEPRPRGRAVGVAGRLAGAAGRRAAPSAMAASTSPPRPPLPAPQRARRSRKLRSGAARASCRALCRGRGRATPRPRSLVSDRLSPAAERAG